MNNELLQEVEKYGYCHFQESFMDQVFTIEIKIYELDKKTYLIRYANDKCVMFNDITVK